MDGNDASEAPQSSKLEVYKDAFAPQPRRRRTKAWERARVEAHAPRLQGQKIWKKIGYIVPQDDKENIEVALAELEKGGAGARKKQRMMGAKENINNASWQSIEEGTYMAGNISQSPKKNRRLSLAAGDADALLIPRKRTNTNHMITPRKALRKITNGSYTQTTLPSPDVKQLMQGCLDGDSQAKERHGNDSRKEDDAREPLFKDSPKLTNLFDTSDEAAGKPERWRKFLQRSTRRLPNGDVSNSVPQEPTYDIQPASPSTAICSAPTFQFVGGAEAIIEAAVDSVEDSGTGSAEVFAIKEGDHEPSLYATKEDRECLPETFCQTLEGSTKVKSDEARIDEIIEESSDALVAKQLFDEAALAELSEEEFNTNHLVPTVEEATVTTPARTINIESPETEFIKVTSSEPTITTKRTPKSKRTPQRGSRRSNRTTRRSVTSADLTSQEPEVPAGDEARPMNQVASLVPPALDDLATQAGNLGMQQHADTTEESTSVEVPSDAVQIHPISQEPAYGGAVDEENEPGDISELELAKLSPAGESMESEDLECAQKPSQPASSEVRQKEANVETAVETADIIQDNPLDTDPASPDDAQPHTTSHGTKDVVDLFPIQPPSQRDAEPQCDEPSDRSIEEFEVPEIPEGISGTAVEDRNDLPLHDSARDVEEATSPDKALAISSRDTSESHPRPLVDHDDTDLLRDFLTRVKANKAAKAATGIPKRKRSLPHSPIRLPLGIEANSSPSALEAKEDEFDVGRPAESPNKRRKRSDQTLDEDELAEPKSTRRSGRTRLPVKAPLTAPSFIPVRRLGQDGDNTITLRRNEDKELAALTKVNTRKNKGNAVLPAQVLAKKAEEKDDPACRQRALKEVFDEKAQKKKIGKKVKSVVWAEELAQFQTEEGKKLVVGDAAEKEQPVEEKKTAVKVGVRSKMALGMAANGTPAPKRKMRGRS